MHAHGFIAHLDNAMPDLAGLDRAGPVISSLQRTGAGAAPVPLVVHRCLDCDSETVTHHESRTN
jgi:hypothetical protein